jgi:hypothetical protein
MIAVSNTTPPRYLIAFEQEHLLGQLFEKVFVPAAVHAELTDARTPEMVRRRVQSLPAWFEVRAVAESAETVFPVTLHQGERECYNPRIVYARKLQAELVIGDERRPAPLDWLDSFCMRNFTGSAEFDDTLPTADGRLEAGLAVDPQRLAQAMSEWFTKRGKGNGQPVTIELREVIAPK